MNDRPRLAVRVTRDAERHVRSGHPWVFDQSIVSVDRGEGRRARPGDLAVVFDARRRFLAIGLFDPTSPIRIRILHRGSPTPIDSAWLGDRIATAFDRRRPLVESGRTTAYRVVHGENDGLGGLVVDRYAEVVVVKLYTSAWVPHLGLVADALDELLAPEGIVVRLARSVQRQPSLDPSVVDGGLLRGVLDTPVVGYRENGLVFEADVVSGHKTGAFLDQRENRELVGGLVDGRTVLDVYCATGGFSAHAVAGGATAVCAIDLSPGAIATARRNVDANRQGGAGGSFRPIVGDAMVEMARLADAGERFDVVVVDPPSFASRHEHVEAAVRAYRRLGTLAARLVEPGGQVFLASCSSRVSQADHERVVTEGMAAGGRRMVDPRRTGHPLDHPIGFPEGAYLKALVGTVGAVRSRGRPSRR